MNMNGFGGNGGLGGAKSSYEAYSLAHGKIPGEAGDAGSVSGGTAARSGKADVTGGACVNTRPIVRLFWLILIGSFVGLLSSSISFLAAAGLAVVIAAAFSLLIYGIARLCTRR